MVVTAKAVCPDDPANARYWCRTWNVTLAQLRIAAGRVGNQPPAVLADILGTPVHRLPSARSWEDCFGRATGEARFLERAHAQPVDVAAVEAVG
jgi:hypothetical protein